MNNTALKTQTKSADMNPSWIEFKALIEKEFFVHPIIHKNEFTEEFSKGEFSRAELKNFTVQFSVFSNLFLVAQLKKMINSPSLSSMRSSKEILASEIGVLFKGQGGRKENINGSLGGKDDFMLVPEGSIDGGTFRFQAAHFEWLLKFGEAQGLGFKDMGRRIHGTESTLHFTDALEELLGSEDPSTAAGASFALENWANKGFWKELITGLKGFLRTGDGRGMKLPLGFFVWHDVVEGQHAEHTMEELEELFFQEEFTLDQDKFIHAGKKLLDALEVFWVGLSEDHQACLP